MSVTSLGILLEHNEKGQEGAEPGPVDSVVVPAGSHQEELRRWTQSN